MTWSGVKRRRRRRRKQPRQQKGASSRGRGEVLPGAARRSAPGCSPQRCSSVSCVPSSGWACTSCAPGCACLWPSRCWQSAAGGSARPDWAGRRGGSLTLAPRRGGGAQLLGRRDMAGAEAEAGRPHDRLD